MIRLNEMVINHIIGELSALWPCCAYYRIPDDDTVYYSDDPTQSHMIHLTVLSLNLFNAACDVSCWSVKPRKTLSESFM